MQHEECSNPGRESKDFGWIRDHNIRTGTGSGGGRHFSSSTGFGELRGRCIRTDISSLKVKHTVSLGSIRTLMVTLAVHPSQGRQSNLVVLLSQGRQSAQQPL